MHRKPTGFSSAFTVMVGLSACTPAPAVTPQAPVAGSDSPAGHGEAEGGHASAVAGQPASVAGAPGATGGQTGGVAGQVGVTAGSAGGPVVVTTPFGPLHAKPENCGAACDALPQLFERPVVNAEHTPPPLSGGTMLATRDGKWLVAADPDRDRVYFVDAVSRALVHVQTLQTGDEPGRVVEDGAGRIHVALRGGHAVASLALGPQAPITRRAVCDLPRGLAYDAVHDTVHVACAEGHLVSMPADPQGAVSRTVSLGRDLRDVIVRGDELLVTRFRSAELLRIGADGTLQKSYVPPTFIAKDPGPVQSLNGPTTPVTRPDIQTSPTTAWRAIDVPGKGSAILHERARTGDVLIMQGGYGQGGCGSSIVESSISVALEGDRVASADLAGATVAVDLASNAAGTLLAVASPGNWGGANQLLVYAVTGSSLLNPLNPTGDITTSTAPATGQFGTLRPTTPCVASPVPYPSPPGQVTAVTFVSDEVVALQAREPAAISFIDVRNGRWLHQLDLAQDSRFDTGHSFFHVRAGAAIACASCHAEGGDDGHVWTFQDVGARRTQSLRGGILGTEPLHWSGDMKDFPELVREVFMKRMSGQELSLAQSDSLAHWIDRQPPLKAAPGDAAAVARGEALFQSAAVGCAKCHSGALFTDNQFANVGTGAEFQVPALRGVSFRLPLMHNGCATTLLARFDPSCGGGDRHGVTSQLTPVQVGELVAYLETL